MSVLPLRGKVPPLDSWKAYQTRRATPQELDEWVRGGHLQNVGIVCGEISGNLVVIDLDGELAYQEFAARFAFLADSYTVRTGSGHGYHVYLYCAHLPPTAQAMNTPLGNLELRSSGAQVVAPPSIHPNTRLAYTVHRATAIRRVNSLSHVTAWIRTFGEPAETSAVVQPPLPGIDVPPHRLGSALPKDPINPRLIAAVAQYFEQAGYRHNREWRNGPCVQPEKHRRSDAKRSFGYNTITGFSKCFVCGTLLLKDITERIGIDPDDYGGLFVSPETDTAAILSPTP